MSAIAILHIKHPELPRDVLSGSWYRMAVCNAVDLDRNVNILRRGIEQYCADERWQYHYIARLTAMMPDKPEAFYIEWLDQHNGRITTSTTGDLAT